jgi:hypothetical protein
MSQKEELIQKITRVRDILIRVATGQLSYKEEQVLKEYSTLRKDLRKDTTIADKLPAIINDFDYLEATCRFIQKKLDTYGDRRIYLNNEFQAVFNFIENEMDNPNDDNVSKILAEVDSEHIQEAWRKALARRAKGDTDGAITIARSMLESVCKHILDQKNPAYNKNADLPALYSEVATAINIAPSQSTDDSFRRIFGGCSNIVNGLANIRNVLGDAHGKSKDAIKVEQRHAELAVNLAGAMAVFLISTFESENNSSESI